MKTGIAVLIIILVLVLGWFFYKPYFVQAPSPESSAPTNLVLGEEKTIAITSSGFSPATLTIKQGDTVKFVNKDSKPHWPASAVHPVHQCYPGFDALTGVQPDESYSFKFDVAKTCKFHDHLNPGTTGTITVE